MTVTSVGIGSGTTGGGGAAGANGSAGYATFSFT